ncbi:MAG: ubiquinol-cytochrome c reductase iron-sulfur subunit [Clostridiales bacterium]|jgi:Rieske Fe-S protein|nr:ubiquinol-cytochrome c reductase iron-sulfur subunit [Clostridiales bacterium]
MKFKESLFSRRQFLNGLLGGWLGAFLASILYPVLRAIFPPEKEPDQVILVSSDYAGIPANTVKMFAWGSKPGLLKKTEKDELVAFVGVCTHLDCNVIYLPDQKKFFCACHDGWYDENGTNISGPPPRPLRRLSVTVEGDNIIIKKEGAT